MRSPRCGAAPHGDEWQMARGRSATEARPIPGHFFLNDLAQSFGFPVKQIAREK